MTNSNDNKEALSVLDKLLEAELSGVVRYLHYSFMIFGPNRIPITKWFRDNAMEGFQHAVVVGEKITAFGGHASLKVKPVPETNKHNVMDIKLYRELLTLAGDDIALEELARKLIAEETGHIEEVEKMLRGGNLDK